MVSTVPCGDARRVPASVVRFDNPAKAVSSRVETTLVEAALRHRFGYDRFRAVLHGHCLRPRVAPRLGTQVTPRDHGEIVIGVGRRGVPLRSLVRTSTRREKGEGSEGAVRNGVGGFCGFADSIGTGDSTYPQLARIRLLGATPAWVRERGDVDHNTIVATREGTKGSSARALVPTSPLTLNT